MNFPTPTELRDILVSDAHARIYLAGRQEQLRILNALWDIAAAHGTCPAAAETVTLRAQLAAAQTRIGALEAEIEWGLS